MNDNHDQSNEFVEYNASINTHIQLLRNNLHRLYREHEFKISLGEWLAALCSVCAVPLYLATVKNNKRYKRVKENQYHSK